MHFLPTKGVLSLNITTLTSLRILKGNTSEMDDFLFRLRMLPKIRSQIKKVPVFVQGTYAEPAFCKGPMRNRIVSKIKNPSQWYVPLMHLRYRELGTYQIYKKGIQNVTKQRGDMIDVFYSVSSPAQYKR